MRILVSNDDGYFAPGISALAEALSTLGEVTVVAPERDRSGASNSLTLDRPLSLKRTANGFYHVNGTPTDCVHLAVTGMLDHLPDMVVSGVNHGAFMGDDLIDLPVMSICGLAIAPANARPITKKHAHLVTETAGGHGAVREACEFILAAQDKLNAAFAPYLDPQ